MVCTSCDIGDGQLFNDKETPAETQTHDRGVHVVCTMVFKAVRQGKALGGRLTA